MKIFYCRKFFFFKIRKEKKKKVIDIIVEIYSYPNKHLNKVLKKTNKLRIKNTFFFLNQNSN